MKPFLREIGKLFNNGQQKTDKLFYGVVKEKIVTNDNVTGYKVSLGGESATIDARKFAGAEVGDTVMLCKLANGSMIVLGRKDGDKDALDAQDTANEAYIVAEDAEDTAEDALNAVDVVQSHFWTDENGVHVTQNESSTAGKNVLINSNGMIIANGNPATASNQLAAFGASKVELGKNSTNAIIEMCGGMFLIKDDTSDGFNNISLIPQSSSMGTGITIYSDDDETSYLSMSEEYIGLKGGSCEFDAVHDIIGDRWTSNVAILTPYLWLSRTPNTGNTYDATWYDRGDGTYALRRSSSARRYKKNIKDITDESANPERLYELHPRQFNWKKEVGLGDDLIVGFIADEVEKAYPPATRYDTDENGEKFACDWDVRAIVPAMLKLIQDQHKEIEELKARVDVLENKNE